MSLPEQIQKQIADADAFLSTLEAPPAPEPQPAPPAPAPTLEAPPAPEPQPAPPAPDDEAKWEHKFKVLQGKYDKEVPRLHATAREQAEALSRLQAQIDDLSRMPQATGDFSAAANGVEITGEEQEAYGADLLDVIGRRALQAVLPEIASIRATIEELRRGFVGVHHEVKVNSHEKFIEALDTQHKNWRKMNNDGDFLAWLDEPDAFSGVPRKDLLQNAVAAHDVARALAFFRGYEAEHGVQPAPREPAPPRRPDTSLEAMAAPGRRSAAPAPAPTDLPEVWSRADIQRFYTDVRRGVFKGKEAEMERIEQSIVRAAAQNNVR